MKNASSKCLFLSEADWINARRAVAYPRIFVIMYALAIAIFLMLCHGLVDPLGKPVGTDFMDVWAAGRLAAEGKPAAAYDYKVHAAVEMAALPYPKGRPIPYYAWHYPPLFLMVASALALLPYGLALLVWMAATLPAYLAAIRAIIPGRDAMMAALAFPAVFVNLGHGQNGFLTAGLLGGALLLLEKRPWLAGVLFGLLAYKPQFGLLIPIALLAGGRWKTIFSATLTVLAAAGASYALFGAETWQAFFGSLALTRDIALEQGATGWQKIQSVFSAVRMYGGGVELAYAAQGIVALAAAAAVAWSWRGTKDADLKSSVLATATLMATPYVLDYDLIILALPVAWMAARGMKNGFLPWEKITLFGVFLLPLFARMSGQFVKLPIGPLGVALLLWVILRRLAREKNVPAG